MKHFSYSYQPFKLHNSISMSTKRWQSTGVFAKCCHLVGNKGNNMTDTCRCLSKYSDLYFFSQANISISESANRWQLVKFQYSAAIWWIIEKKK